MTLIPYTLQRGPHSYGAGPKKERRSWSGTLAPTVRISLKQGFLCISFRWIRWGFDILNSDKKILIQFGSRPVKFVAIGNGIIILSAHAWSNHKRLGPFAWGITRKPIDVRRFYVHRTEKDSE